MLKDKTVFITGASSGIGAATAAYFARHDARLLLCARRLDALNILADHLRAQYNVTIHTFQLDVCDQKAVNQSIENLPEAFRHVDVLVNNAGLAAGLDSFQEANLNDWELMIDTNIKGLLYVTKIFLPSMIERNTGHIINIGSIAAHTVYPKGNVYCATKHAVKALSDALRMDLFGTKIRVSLIDPGAVETNFSVTRFKGDSTRASAVYAGMTPLTPEDIADAILYCVNCPPHVNISDIVIMPTDQASATMVSRHLEE